MLKKVRMFFALALICSFSLMNLTQVFANEHEHTLECEHNYLQEWLDRGYLIEDENGDLYINEEYVQTQKSRGSVTAGYGGSGTLKLESGTTGSSSRTYKCLVTGNYGAQFISTDSNGKVASWSSFVNVGALSRSTITVPSKVSYAIYAGYFNTTGYTSVHLCDLGSCYTCDGWY